MAEGNLEKTREGFEALERAFETRDFDAYVEEYIDPEVEWVPFKALPDSSGITAARGSRDDSPSSSNRSTVLGSKSRRSSTMEMTGRWSNFACLDRERPAGRT